MVRFLIIIFFFHICFSLKAQAIKHSDTISFIKSKEVHISNPEKPIFEIYTPSFPNLNTIPISERHNLGYFLRRQKDIRDSIYEHKKKIRDLKFNKTYESISPRKPLIAIGMSLLIPGAGQAYNKQYISSGYFFASETLLAISIYSLNQTSRSSDFLDIKPGIKIFSISLLASIHLFQTIMAPFGSKTFNSRINTFKNRNHVSWRLSPVFLQQERSESSNLPAYSSTRPYLSPGLSLALRW